MSGFRFIDHITECSKEQVIPVLSEQDVVRTLKQRQRGEPRFVALVSPTGDTLMIGVGGPLGCVMFGKASGDPPYLWALGTSRAQDIDIEFDAGTPTPVPIRRCLFFEDVLKIVVHYFRSGELLQDVEWEAD